MEIFAPHDELKVLLGFQIISDGAFEALLDLLHI